MIRRILALSLVVVPLYEVILYFVMPGRSMPTFPDMRITKDFVALAFSLAIGLLVLFNSGFKPFKEKWLLLFMAFLVWNLFKVPNVGIQIGTANVNGMWNYLPAYQIMAYFLLFLGIVNSPNLMHHKVVNRIGRIIGWTGAVMAGYMVLQSVKLDQIFNTFPAYLNGITINGSTKNAEMGGTLGHPTLSAPFVVMAIPFVIFYIKKWLLVAVMSAAVVLSGSSFAILSLAVTLWCVGLYTLRGKSRSMYYFISVIAVTAVIASVFFWFHDMINDNGRFSVWGQVFNDLFEKIGLTGAGIGSFKFLYALKNGNTWYHAHNDYLQLLWSCGIIGAGIVFMFLKDIFVRAINNISDDVVAFGIAFISLLVCAFGTFIFQMGAFQYYAVVILGMIYLLTREVQSA